MELISDLNFTTYSSFPTTNHTDTNDVSYIFNTL